MAKGAKHKGKTCVRKVKAGKCAAEKQDVTSNESTDSIRKTLTTEMRFLGQIARFHYFKITLQGDCLCFCIKVSKCFTKKPPFSVMNDKFRFDSDFFVRNLDASMERSTRRGNGSRRTRYIQYCTWPHALMVRIHSC